MHTKTADISAWTVLGAVAVASTFFAGDVAAQGDPVTVAIHVSTQGINLNEPAGARELYRRLENAAWIACTGADRVGLEPVPDPNACYERALGEAIHSVHAPLLTQAYLEKHLLSQAAAYGIEVPMQVAAK